MCKSCGGPGPELQHITVTVEGMSCGHCKNAVEKAVKGLPGVLAAEVDLAAKSLQVDFDPAKTSLQDIKDVVEDAGYTIA